MKVFVYCDEGIGYICDAVDEVDLEEFPYSYMVKKEKENDKEAEIKRGRY